MPKLDREARLAAAAFRLLGKGSWRDLTLAAVARAAKLPWPDVFSIAPSKAALPGLLLRRLGAETARRYKPDRASKGARERVFDVAMTWFDVQRSRKAAMRSLYDGIKRDPLALLPARGDILAAADQIRALAEADTGASAQVGTAILAGVLMRAVPIWLDDDHEMGKTMARLDRDLRRIERFLWPRSTRPRRATHPGR